MNRFGVQVQASRLDLELCVRSGQVFRWRKLPDGSWIGVDGPRWYAVTSSEPDVFEVESNGSEEDFRSLFRLDWDAEAVERAILRSGPELEPYLDQLKGLRLLRPSDPVETFFCFLCTPNNHIARITAMVGKLANSGEVIAERDGAPIHRFPSLERIAALSETDLRAQGFGYRGATIPLAARQMLEKPEGWLQSLKLAPYEDARRQLIEIKGVGPKLADCIALFALEHVESVPVDTHIWQALTRLYFPEWMGLALTDQRYQSAAGHFRDRFGKHAGWAHQYLFYDDVLHSRERRIQPGPR